MLTNNLTVSKYAKEIYGKFVTITFWKAIHFIMRILERNFTERAFLKGEYFR